ALGEKEQQMTATDHRQSGGGLTRRDLLEKLGLAGSVLLTPALLHAQGPDAGARSGGSGSTSARDFSPGAPPQPYPDPDVLAVDPSLNALRQFNAPIQ